MSYYDIVAICLPAMTYVVFPALSIKAEVMQWVYMAGTEKPQPKKEPPKPAAATGGGGFFSSLFSSFFTPSDFSG